MLEEVTGSLQGLGVLGRANTSRIPASPLSFALVSWLIQWSVPTPGSSAARDSVASCRISFGLDKAGIRSFKALVPWIDTICLKQAAW